MHTHTLFIPSFLHSHSSVFLGIYHRFSCDEKDIIHAMRLFKGQPVWTPFNRPCDDHPSRKNYVEEYLGEEKKVE